MPPAARAVTAFTTYGCTLCPANPGRVGVRYRHIRIPISVTAGLSTRCEGVRLKLLAALDDPVEALAVNSGWLHLVRGEGKSGLTSKQRRLLPLVLT